MNARIAVVVSGFPRVSETFALNELVAMAERGMLAAIFATKPGDWSRVQPQVERLRGLVQTLPDGDVRLQADALVDSLDDAVTGVHGYFAHVPAAVAAASAETLGVPYGFSAHALDVRKVGRGELAARARNARGVLTCNGETRSALRHAGVVSHLVPHGVDVERFRPEAAVRAPGGALRVLAVGRLVEKKGFPVLLRALAATGPDITLRILGAGPEENALRRLAADLHLGPRVRLAGPTTHSGLAQEYAAADVVAVPSHIDRAGDRDGLPNVVLEAMASGRAIVASATASIPDAIEHRVTGLLVPPQDPAELAAAIDELARNAALREALGRAARERAAADYDLTRCTDALCARMEGLYG